MDCEFSSETRAIATARLKSLCEKAVEPSFSESMQLAIDIGYTKSFFFVYFILTLLLSEKGWEHPELNKLMQGQPMTPGIADENLLLPVCLRLLYRAKKWEKVSIR